MRPLEIAIVILLDIVKTPDQKTINLW